MKIMYVYFDSTGAIHAITPLLDANHPDNLQVAEFPLSTVSQILSGEKMLASVTVSTISDNNISTHILVSNETSTQIKTERTLDKCVSNVSNNNRADILIENYISVKELKISILSSHAALSAISATQLYFTKKNDPHILLFTAQISPKDISESNGYTFKYLVDLSGASLYMYNINDRYSYKEINVV